MHVQVHPTVDGDVCGRTIGSCRVALKGVTRTNGSKLSGQPAHYRQRFQQLRVIIGMGHVVMWSVRTHQLGLLQGRGVDDHQEHGRSEFQNGEGRELGPELSYQWAWEGRPGKMRPVLRMNRIKS